MNGGAGRRRGVALVLTLVIMLALTVLAHGALVLVRAEGRAADALTRAVEMRLVGRAALGRATALLASDTLPTLAVGGADTSTIHGAALVMERLGREVLLLTVGPGGTETPAGAWPESLLWAADPVARIAASPAVSAGGVVNGDGAVAVAGFWAVAPEDPPWCDVWWTVLDSLASGAPPRIATAPLPLDTDDSGGPGAAAHRLGRLPPDSVLARLVPFPAGTVTPGPGADAVCLDGPANWGSATDPAHPCADRRVALVVDGSLTMAGGEGQGVLAVTGSLTLTSGAVMAGIVTVGGDLVIGGGARVRGIVRVGGDVDLTDGGRVEGAACPVLLALSGDSPLRRPVRLPGPILAWR